MATNRKQNYCRDCKYAWFPHHKKEECPKCKGTNVRYASRVGPGLLMLLITGALVAAGAFGVYKFVNPDPELLAEEKRRADSLEASVPPDPPEDEEDEPRESPAEESTTTTAEPPPTTSESLTDERTWTARDGRTLQAKLLKLELVDGKYVGHFERPNGETFQYAIGDLSKADVDLVRGLVAEQ